MNQNIISGISTQEAQKRLIQHGYNEISEKKINPIIKFLWKNIFRMSGIQFAVTLIAVYGVFMKPLGWQLAGFVWAWALAFFVLNDFIKIYFYKRMERLKPVNKLASNIEG